MIPTPIAEVAGVLRATVVGDPADDLVSADVEVDSRLVQPGGLFVALPGEHTDGHDHAAAAVSLGAVAAVTARPVDGVPCLVVPDPLAGLQALARDLWRRAPIPAVGITGSSGKTSTKDLLAQVLRHDGPTLAPVGSYNNELGLPLTALRRQADTRYAVLEYSARGPGHITFLCDLVPPTVAVVLNVGSAHLGEFGSEEAVAAAKGELVEAAGDLVVLNADDPAVLAMAARAPAGVQVRTFGTGPDADYRADHVHLDQLGRPSFVLVDTRRDLSTEVALSLHGGHHVSNALATAAVVLSLARDDVASVAAHLSAARPQSRWRMEVTERPDGVTVVNDAYNANPESMRAALEALTAMGAGRRTIAVLGPMAELGEHARERHADLGALVGRLGIDRLVVVGTDAEGVHHAGLRGGSASIHVDGVDEAVALLEAELRPDDVVLLKASRSAGLERIADRLLADPA